MYTRVHKMSRPKMEYELISMIMISVGLWVELVSAATPWMHNAITNKRRSMFGTPVGFHSDSFVYANQLFANARQVRKVYLMTN